MVVLELKQILGSNCVLESGLVNDLCSLLYFLISSRSWSDSRDSIAVLYSLLTSFSAVQRVLIPLQNF